MNFDTKMISLLKDINYYVKLVPGFIEISLWRNYKKIFGLRQKYKGRRCFIMGNGPSLNKMPLEKLSDEFVWAVNRCYLLFDKIRWRPQFYTAVDSLVVPNIANELNELIGLYSDIQFFFPEEFYYSNILRHRENILWFRHRNMDPVQRAKGYFSTNAFKYVRVPNTVVITALQLAVYLGFNPIILIGCDTKYVVPEGSKQEGEAIDPGTGEIIRGYEITSTKDNDPNHFDPSYFGAGYKWHFPNVKGMLLGYRYAKQACDKIGVKILNATVGGHLEVFPRVNFETLFLKVAPNSSD